jgi:DNA-directed RNA polymerase subunit beta'
MEQKHALDFLMESLGEKPPEDGGYTSGYIKKVFSKIARDNPDLYPKLMDFMSRKGQEFAYTSGSTLTLSDFEAPFDKASLFAPMEAELTAVKSQLKGEDYEKARQIIWDKYREQVDDLMGKSLRGRQTNLGNTVLSGARGKPVQLRALAGAAGQYTDYKGRPIPYFSTESFGEGVRPATLLANSFGSRTSVIATKRATADAGDLGKLFFQSANDIMVTMDDCGTTNGILIQQDGDEDPLNSVLLEQVGDYAPGTMVDKAVASAIRKSKKPVHVRSAMTCQAPNGVCSKCLGKVPTRSGWAPIGYAAGTTAGTALAEPMAQNSLDTKHTGAAYTGGARQYSGLKVLRQFLESPENFAERQQLSEEDGTVIGIREAPQGGKYIVVEGGSGKAREYYTPEYLDAKVKIGDTVERGQELSDGLADVEDVIRLKGIGAGRMYYARRLGKILADSGQPASRQNLEVIARAAVNHAEIDGSEDVAGFLPGEVASFNEILGKLRPPKSAQHTAPRQAVGKILYTPTLHYTPGTVLTKSMVDEIDSAGIKQIMAGDESLGFSPAMVGLRRSNKRIKDWLARQNTSYLKGNYEEDAGAGRDTHIGGTTFYAPSLAHGDNFGEKTHQTGKF